MPKIKQFLKTKGENGNDFVTTADFGTKNIAKDHKYSVLTKNESGL